MFQAIFCILGCVDSAMIYTFVCILYCVGSATIYTELITLNFEELLYM